MSDSEFQGRVVVVTGAAGALGSAVVTHFAGLGARIAQLDVIKLNNGHYSATPDLTDAAASRAAVEAIYQELGPIHVLANIAGGFAMGEAVHETPPETWDFLMGLNAHTVLNMARAVVPVMLEHGGGRIINIGAGAGQHGVGNMGAYSASKSVVIRLTEAMADELPAHRGHGGRAEGERHQRQLHPAEHHRHRAESGGHARRGLLEMGTAGSDGEGDRLSGVRSGRADSRGGPSGERVELICTAPHRGASLEPD